LPAAYGGNDLSQANTVYLDSHWGIGASVRELVQGVDCPMTAAYIDAVTFFKGASKPNLHKNAICVFEHNPGRMLLVSGSTLSAVVVVGKHTHPCAVNSQRMVKGNCHCLT
jgi:hypothetical protein